MGGDLGRHQSEAAGSPAKSVLSLELLQGYHLRGHRTRGESPEWEPWMGRRCLVFREKADVVFRSGTRTLAEVVSPTVSNHFPSRPHWSRQRCLASTVMELLRGVALCT